MLNGIRDNALARPAIPLTALHTMEHDVRLRASTLADLNLLKAWDAKHHVRTATGPDGFLDWEAELQRSVPWREFLIAESDGRSIAALQIIDPALEETHYLGRHRAKSARARHLDRRGS